MTKSQFKHRTFRRQPKHTHTDIHTHKLLAFFVLIKRSLFFCSLALRSVFGCCCCYHCWRVCVFDFRTPAVVYNFSSLCLIIIVHQNPDLLLKHRKKYVNDFFCSFYLFFFNFIPFVLFPLLFHSLSRCLSVHRYLSISFWMCFHLLLLPTIKMCTSKSCRYKRVPFFGRLVVNRFVCSVCSFDPVHSYTQIHTHTFACIFFGITGFHLQMKRQLLSSSFLATRVLMSSSLASIYYSIAFTVLLLNV